MSGVRGARGALGARGVLARLGATVRDLAGRVVADPVREGRIHTAGWPAGLAPIALLGVLGIAAAAALTLASGWLRQELVPGQVTAGSDALLPRAVIWVVFLLVGLSIAIAQTGALHAAPLVRWTVTAITALALLLMAVPDSSPIPLARAFAGLAVVALLVLVAGRGRSAFHWAEFATIACLVWGSAIVSLAVVTGPARGYGYDFAPLLVSLVLTTLTPLAVPGAIAAGSAMAELAISTGTWAVEVLRARIGMAAVAVVAALALGALALGLVEPVEEAAADPLAALGEVGSAVVLLVALWALWRAIQRLRADHGPLAGREGVAGVLGEIGPIALAVAAIISPALIASLAQLLGFIATMYGAAPWAAAWLTEAPAVLTSYTAINAARGVVGVALVVAALVLARRGRRGLPELLAAIGLTGISFGLSEAVGIEFAWSDAAVVAVPVAAAVALAALAAIRGRASRSTLSSAAVMVVVAALFLHRELIADPLAAVIGTAGAAAVLLGQLWNFATGNAPANGDSPRYPRPARALLAIGWTLFALTALAYAALARDPDAVIDLGSFALVGDALFGHALFACAAIAILRAIAAPAPPVEVRPAGERAPAAAP